MEAGTALVLLCSRPEKHLNGDACHSLGSLVAVVAARQHADSAAVEQLLADARNFRSFIDSVLGMGSAFGTCWTFADPLTACDPGHCLSSWTTEVVDLHQATRRWAHWLSRSP